MDASPVVEDSSVGDEDAAELDAGIADASTSPDASIAQGTVPEGLSLALVQLHHEGLIELVAGDDASDRVTLAPGGIADSAGHETVAIARIRRKAAKG